MLVFGGLSFESLYDGEIEVNHTGVKQSLSQREIYELQEWLRSHAQQVWQKLHEPRNGVPLAQAAMDAAIHNHGGVEVAPAFHD